MTFLAPWALLGLLGLPLLAGIYTIVRRRASPLRTGVLTYTDAARQTSDQTMATSPAARRRTVVAALLLAAIATLLFSLARPEMDITLPVRTGQIILAFDTSNSMLANDVEPTRLDVAKDLGKRFVDRQPGSVQIGVVAFTNGGLVVQQPTRAQAEVVSAIDRLATDGGTSIGEGIFASLTAIANGPIDLGDSDVELDTAALDIGYFSNAAIVLFTDGEEIGGADPVAVAGLAANSGVAVYTVGIGTRDGTVVPLDGFSIATALDESLLTAISESTGGEYFLAADDPELSAIFDAIDRSFERQGERIEITALLAMIAIVLVITAGALSFRWFGRVL